MFRVHELKKIKIIALKINAEKKKIKEKMKKNKNGLFSHLK